MDELQEYELPDLADYSLFSYKNEWEICRMSSWAAIKPHCKIHKGPSDLFPLPTDQADSDDEPDEETLKRIRNKAKEMENKFKKEHN